jgi:hypothetical protein
VVLERGVVHEVPTLVGEAGHPVADLLGRGRRRGLDRLPDLLQRGPHVLRQGREVCLDALGLVHDRILEGSICETGRSVFRASFAHFLTTVSRSSSRSFSIAGTTVGSPISSNANTAN